MSLFKQKPKTEREKVEERREEVLAHGRKFKYPLQYAKHRLMINTVIVALVALILMVVAGWAMLFNDLSGDAGATNSSSRGGGNESSL